MAPTVDETTEQKPREDGGDRRAVAWRAGLILIAFVALTTDVLTTWFDHDDFMNLYQYLQAGWGVIRGLVIFWSSHYYRPLGGFVYLSIYSLFGFHPLPFKITIYCVLLANLILAGWVARLIFGSARVAAVVIAITFYHGAEFQLYYNFGTLYDVFCFFFVYAAMGVYVRLRLREEPISGRWLAALAVLQVLALDCKEMGSSLPVLLLLYELVIRRALTDRAKWRDLAPVLVLGAIVAAFIIGKSIGPESLMSNHFGYKPQLTVRRYMDNMSSYLGQLFYSTGFFSHARTAQFLCAGPLVALAIRSPKMLFGWLWFVAAMLPVAFILTRSPFVLYIPALGLAIAFVAGWQDFGKRVIAPRAPRTWRLLSANGFPLFATVLVLSFIAQSRGKKIYASEMEPIAAYRNFALDFLALNQHPKPGARILLLDDPFRESVWDAMFLLSLVRGDMKLTSVSAKENLIALSPGFYKTYDEVYDFGGTRLWRIPGPLLPSYLSSNYPDRGQLKLLNGVYFDASAASWTAQDFALDATCPSRATRCAVDLSVALPNSLYQGAERHVSVTVDGDPAGSFTIRSELEVNHITAIIGPSGGNHLVRYHLDQAAPQSGSGDIRQLGVLLSDGTISAQ